MILHTDRYRGTIVFSLNWKMPIIVIIEKNHIKKTNFKNTKFAHPIFPPSSIVDRLSSPHPTDPPPANFCFLFRIKSPPSKGLSSKFTPQISADNPSPICSVRAGPSTFANGKGVQTPRASIVELPFSTTTCFARSLN